MLHERFSMHKPARTSSAVVLMVMTAAFCSAQSVTSAHSGTIHYFEGDVSVDGAPLQSKVGRFSEIKEQGTMRTGQGRAEVLLTPGIFLRAGENSAIKMLDNRLASTRVEILSGNVVVESDDPQMSIKDSPVTLLYKDYEIQMVKHGLVEISTDPAQLKVYKGEAVVTAANDRATVREGRQLPFSAALLTEKFDDKVGDELYLWARDRSQSISAANMSSARSLNSTGGGYGSGYGYGTGYGYGSGYGYGGGYGSGLGGWNGGWYFNPYFNMFTFVPAAGTFFNPWGYGFYSPGTIYSYYTPGSYWYGGGGSRGVGLVGRPVAGVGNTSTNRAAPLSTLRAGNPGGGFPALGSPVRAGSAIGAGAGGAAGSSVGGSRGGMSSSGGAGGHMSAGGGGGAGGHGGGGHGR